MFSYSQLLECEVLKDMQCRLLVYKQHSMHWRDGQISSPSFALSQQQEPANTNTLTTILSAVLCLIGNNNVWDLWGINLLVEGGGGWLSLILEVFIFVCMDTSCPMTSDCND